MVDTYVKHTTDDFADVLEALLPEGNAWPRDDDATQNKAVKGLAGPWGDVANASDAFLVHESDPRTTVNLLAYWERNFGLPDPCVAEPLTIADRQTTLVQKMTTQGGQSRQFFIDAAAKIGYTITIKEHSPFMCGVSAVGDTRVQQEPSAYSVPGVAFDDASNYRWEIGPPEIRFYWTVHVHQIRLSRFHVAAGQCGVDPLLRIGFATDLECLLNRWKPTHTKIVFDYSPLATGLDFSQPQNSGYWMMGFV